MYKKAGSLGENDMDTYTVLLVDDEEEVIQIIMKKINWESLGFSVAGYACNGVKALELVEEYQPDVVITDIKMPYMDGMELSAHIKAEFPTTKILIFTGFDEFEYAREAIHLEIEEYILKPVNSAELANIFAQLKIKLDREISERRNVEVLQNYYMESLPLLQMNFFSTLIEGRIHEDEISGYLSDYQIVFNRPFFCCLVIHTSANQVPENMNPLLLCASVQQQAKEKLCEKWQAKSFPYLGNMVLIAQLKSETEISELTDECDRFCKYARHIIGAVVTIGIGRVCRDISDLSQSYSDAREAVSYRVIYGSSRAINMKEIVPHENDRSDMTDDTKLTGLFKMIRMGTKEDVIEVVNNYLNHTFLSERSLTKYQIDVMDLVSALCRFSANQDIAPDIFSGNIKQLYGRLLDMEADALKEWLTDKSLSLRAELISVRSQSTSSFVSRAKEYIHNNYVNEELSLDLVCQILGVSNSYFSTIFKKQTGSSFIGYLTDFRMDRASRLLVETNEKSYIIAKKVGYTDPNYFSYVFKRRFGVSPSKFRSEHTENGS